MKRENFNHGFSDSAWEAAKAEAKQVLADIARRGTTIAYSDLTRQIRAISIDYHEKRLFHFLGEISSEEEDAGRGMLTVVVVHKNGDQEPGPGFYELASALGRDTSDKYECWISELTRVYEIWARRK